MIKYPPARFVPECRDSIAHGFARAVGEFGVVIHACAIGFDHVHVVVARDEIRDVEQIVSVLKARATLQMSIEGTHPLRDVPGRPTPWGKKCWKVFINDGEQLRNAVDYVQRHPMKEGLVRQEVSFITPV